MKEISFRVSVLETPFAFARVRFLNVELFVKIFVRECSVVIKAVDANEIYYIEMLQFLIFEGYHLSQGGYRRCGHGHA